MPAGSSDKWADHTRTQLTTRSAWLPNPLSPCSISLIAVTLPTQSVPGYVHLSPTAAGSSRIWESLSDAASKAT